MLLEEKLLFLVDQVHDVIVVSNNQHDVLLHDAQVFSLLMQLGKVDMQIDEAMLLDLVPVVDFDQDLT